MSWQLFNSYILDVNTNEITIPTNFTDTELIVKVTPVTVSPTWRYFGELEQWTNFVNAGDTRLYMTKLKLGTSLLRLNNDYPYELKLLAYHWLPLINIDIFRDI